MKTTSKTRRACFWRAHCSISYAVTGVSVCASIGEFNKHDYNISIVREIIFFLLYLLEFYSTVGALWSSSSCTKLFLPIEMIVHIVNMLMIHDANHRRTTLWYVRRKKLLLLFF